jgi:hypothetical protein
MGWFGLTKDKWEYEYDIMSDEDLKKNLAELEAVKINIDKLGGLKTITKRINYVVKLIKTKVGTKVGGKNKTRKPSKKMRRTMKK